jgi:hypothetical protein
MFTACFQHMIKENKYMPKKYDDIPNGQDVYRMNEVKLFPKKALLLGVCSLLTALAVGLFTLMVPTASASAASPRNLGWLGTNPTVLDNLGANRSCTYDSHGGAPYVRCTITLKNTSTRETVRWAASSSNPRFQLFTRSGRLAPNASVRVTFSENGLACPDRSTITFTGPHNVVRVPVICNDIVVTPNKNSFSSKSCTRDRRGNWTCMVRVSADPKDTEPVQWSASVINSRAAAAAIKLFPTTGTVSLERRGRVLIDRSQFVKITVPASWGCKTATIFFHATGTPQISRQVNMLNWSCRR